MGPPTPAAIKLRPVAGGTFHTIYRLPTGSIKAYASSNSTLLFTQWMPGSAETLWKINTDGSGLARLMTAPNGGARFDYSPYVYNGSLYALEVSIRIDSIGDAEDSLVFGSLAGGTQKTIVKGQKDVGETIVGWARL